MSVAASRTPTLAEALRETIDFKLAQVHTVLPGRIQSYDKDTQTAEVKVCVRRKVHTEEGDVIAESFPVLPNVRVEFSQTANFFMSFPLATDDFVWVHFVEQSVDSWFKSGGEDVDDPIARRFDLADAFAVPARDPSAPIEDAKDDAIVLGYKGGDNARAYFKQNEIALGEENPSEFVALATKTKNEITALRNTVNNFVTTFNSHTHSAGAFAAPPAGGSVTGVSGGPTGSASSPATVNDVAAAVVKAK